MPKKKVGKISIYGPKPRVNPYEKMSNFCLFKRFYTLGRCFFVVEYHKRHFPGLYCLRKKFGKISIFGPKPWVNPLWKNVKFSTFLTACFYILERCFFVQEYHKRHFPSLYCLKKKSWKNGHFWTKTMG